MLQRVRTAGSELIEEQEIFRRLSVQPESEPLRDDRAAGVAPCARRRSAARAASRPLGAVRPGRWRSATSHSNADGDDGGPLTDYDVIGSAAAGTGMFALKSASGFNLLCIPPLTREQDVGLSTLMIAARFCREQHAMLVVDPPLAWTLPASRARVRCATGRSAAKTR